MKKYKDFTPDYTNMVQAAFNKRPARIPLYEHIISDEVIEAVLDRSFADLRQGDYADKKEYFRQYASFFKQMGYDTVSFECVITGILPGAGALYDNADPVIKTREDFEKYPFDKMEALYFETYADDYAALGETMPAGMKAIGGPGNGVFEIVQDLVGYQELCYIGIDDPTFYAELFDTVGRMMLRIWKRFLENYSDTYCVCRFGDDLGFRSQTLLSAEDIRHHIIPQYTKLVAQVHSYNKPFLLHSCGAIFDVMDDLMDIVKINAKHSNEDAIAIFDEWVVQYGDKIGNFGGIDTDVLCREDLQQIEEYVQQVYERNHGKNGGIALGSGNSIPDYIPAEGYLTMIRTIRDCRDD